MAKALSMDLRSRVVAAMGVGMPCRQAATHFGISASSAIRWRGLALGQGAAQAKRQGGDRRSDRIEAHAKTILGLLAAAPDMTLAEIRAALIDKGAAFGIGTLWRFFQRRRNTLKKRPHPRPSRTVPTSGSSGPRGSRASSISIPHASCSSMRPGPPPR